MIFQKKENHTDTLQEHYLLASTNLNILRRMCHSHTPSLIGKTIWVLYLAVALAFVQGARLHVHVYNHDPVVSDHSHQEQAHSLYKSEKVHLDEVAVIDLSPLGLLKSLLFGSLVIALFATVIVILSARLLSREPWFSDHRDPFVSWFFKLRPPPRAPPL